MSAILLSCVVLAAGCSQMPGISNANDGAAKTEEAKRVVAGPLQRLNALCDLVDVAIGTQEEEAAIKAAVECAAELKAARDELKYRLNIVEARQHLAECNRALGLGDGTEAEASGDIR